MSFDASELDEAPLGVLFARARAYMKDHASGDSSRGKAMMEVLSRCQSMIESAGVFSTNEDQDDICTGDLKYLLVPYYSAELLSSLPEPQLGQRLANVQRAAQLHSAFLHRCAQYSLQGRACVALYERQEEGLPLDVNTQRMSKVERFKRERAVAQELEALEARAGGVSGVAGSEAAAEAGPGAVDEEQQRRLWLLTLEGACLRALEQRGMLRQEVELLEHALERQAGSGPSSGSSQEQQRARAEERAAKQAMAQQLRGIVGQLQGGERERLRQQVFRPSHILPSLTVEQQGLIELREAQERQQREADGQKSRQAATADVRSDDEDEAALAKARAWDDFKDDNPAGSGNSKLRPCA